jgi:hypothetical protein
VSGSGLLRSKEIG